MVSMRNHHSRSIAGLLLLYLGLVGLPVASAVADDAASAFLVRNGVAAASIVVADDAPRLARLAATELQEHIERMSGVSLPLGGGRNDEYPVAVYVGRSVHTDALGISADGLRHGGFRIVSGPDFLVLLGYDEDFVPPEPWPRNNSDRERVQQEWQEMTGGTWGNPIHGLFRSYHRSSGLWEEDEGGTLQAVYAFLRSLGVRWYMPGEIGLIMPVMDTIALPVVDVTDIPDFMYRDLRLGNFQAYRWDDLIWAFRLGLNNRGLAGSHGMRLIHGSEVMQREHPEYFALVGDRRDTGFRGSGHACFSSAGLFDETIRFARSAYDIYGLEAVSIFPQDGYRHCGCDLCRDLSPSEAVWGFVERVAGELYTTHPDRLVLCGAYGSYRYPPDSIERFSPNVLVRISSVRPGLDADDNWAAFLDLVNAWKPLLGPNRIMRNANVQWTASPVFPIIFPRSSERELAYMKGISLGDSSSVPRSPDQRWGPLGQTHLNMYVLAKYLWNSSRDLDSLLDEYYELFYGPAAIEMKTAFEFAEAAYPRGERPNPHLVPLQDRVRFVELLEIARQAAGDGVFAERIQLVLDSLLPLDELRALLALEEARGEIPEFPYLQNMSRERFNAARGTFVLDGVMDELFWLDYSGQGALRPNSDAGGRRARATTRFRMRWLDDHLYIVIVCQEPGETGGDAADGDVFDGDFVALLLETDSHSFYEIAVSRDGRVVDIDHSRDGPGERWLSQADVAVSYNQDSWTVEMKIPVTASFDDPLHQVVGGQPSRSFPWHFNVVRQRITADGPEWTAFNPTNNDNLKDHLGFARLFIRHSQ